MDSENNIKTDLLYLTVNPAQTPQDTTAPIITLLGDNPIIILLDSNYTDAGATANDTVDGDITSSIVIVNPVNTSVLETYIITYNVQDAAGNNATQVTRTVTVVEELDTTAPQVIIIFPKAKTYYSKDRLFKVQLNENADVKFSLDGEDNVSMDKIADYIFTYEDRVSYGTHELIVYATDDVGNVGSSKVTFKVRKKSSNNDEEEDDEIIIPNNYYEEVNGTIEEIILSSSKPKSMLGWIILLFLGIGILVMLLLILLIKRDMEKKPEGIYEQEIYESADELY